MANPEWTLHDPWDDLLASLSTQAVQTQAGVFVSPVTHAFAADILLPRTGAAGLSPSLPPTGRFATIDGLRVACLTPHHYLLTADNEPSSQVIEQVFGPQAERIEQSGARASLIVSGSALRECLRRGIAIDLDPIVFPPQSFAATYAGHIPVHVTALTEDRLELSCPLSMVGSFWHWLYETGQAFTLARG